MVIEAFALLVPMRQLQALFAPEPLHLLVVYPPSFGTQQRTNLAIAIATILLGQPDQGEAEIILVWGR